MKELFQPHYESFKTVNIEGFNDHGYATALSKKDFEGQTNALNAMGLDYTNNVKRQNNNYDILNANITVLQNLPYKNSDVQLVNRNKNANNNIDKAREEDSELFLVQQNYLYILGTITFAIVALGGIVIANN
jgi:hypothetical protein